MPEILYGASGDIREELNQGAIPGDQSYLDETKIKGALIQSGRKSATRLINAKLEPVYPDQIPFASGDVPVFLDTIANTLAVYFVKRSKHPGPAPMSDNIKAEYYDKPIGWLDDLAERKMDLSELTSKISVAKSFFTHEGRKPAFDVDDTLEQQVDPYLLSDIADARD